MKALADWFTSVLMGLLQIFNKFWSDIWADVKFLYDGTLDFFFGIFDYILAWARWIFVNLLDVMQIDDFLKWLIKNIFLIYLDLVIWFLPISYAIAQEVLQSLAISYSLIPYWDAVPDDIKGLVSAFYIPQLITMVFAARIYKFTIKIIMLLLPFGYKALM